MGVAKTGDISFFPAQTTGNMTSLLNIAMLLFFTVE